MLIEKLIHFRFSNNENEIIGVKKRFIIENWSVLFPFNPQN